MGKRNRSRPNVEEVLARPWCYYCERDFEDLKLLISHQKAKHFKCDRCGRRLNTAGGLSVHLNQVHKETLSHVENALPNRQGLEVEIFGMEGIPQEALDQHRNRIIQNFYQAQEDRRIATGNPASGHATPRKKMKIETADELLRRLAEFRAQKKAGIIKPGILETGSIDQVTEGQLDHQQPVHQQPAVDQSVYSSHALHGTGTAETLPARPPSSTTIGSGLPQRPPQAGHWASEGPQGDDIDQLIRMAEAGVKPSQSHEPEINVEKKSKKEKKGKMVYDDMEFSPEERMAALPRYAFLTQAGA